MNCTESTPSNCVIWNGQNIPCLGLCKGDTVSEIVVKLATKICALAEPTDLSSISLQCILDTINGSETGTRTEVSVIKLLIQHGCTLKQLINNLQTQLSNLANPTFIVDLKCLAQFDSYGNILAYNQQTVIQGLINEVCTAKGQIVFIEGKLTNLQNQIDNIDVSPHYTESTIVTCINPNSLPVSTQVKNIANEYCDFRNILGSDANIQTAIARLGSNIITIYQSFQGWVLNPTNWMQVASNYGIVINDLLNRITTIEKTCCATTCDSVKIGFSVEFTEDGMILHFRDIDGTKIPIGFVDTGSIMTITDKVTGNKTTANLVIAQNYESSLIPLSGFSKNNDIVFSLASKMSNGSLTCNKCNEKTLKYEVDSCCVLTNTGSDDATIIYTTPLTSNG